MAQVTIDISLWTQEQKNLIKAMASRLLYAGSITHDGISVSNGIITVENNSSVIDVCLTAQTIMDAYDDHKTQSDAATAAAIVLEQEKEDILKTNILSTVTFAQIETYIDNNVIDLASAKEVLKKIVKYIKAMER